MTARAWREIGQGGGMGMLLGGCAVLSTRSWMALAAPLSIAGTWWVLSVHSRWVFAFLAAVLLLPPMPLPWGDSGVHFGIAIAALGLWSGVLRLAAWRLRLTFLGAALAALVAALLASVPWALVYSGPALAAASLARAGLLATGVYLFFDLAWGPARRVRAGGLVRCLFWAGSASAAFAVVDFLFQLPPPARFAEQFVWLSSGVFRRAQGVFYEASTLGCFCAFLLVMVAGIAVTGVRQRLSIQPLWLWSGATVMSAALIFSFSRAAIVNLVVSLCVLAILERRCLRTIRFGMGLPLTAGACAGAAVTLAAFVFPEYLTAYLAKLRHSAEFFLAEPNVVLSQRLDSWSLLWDYLRENPWSAALGIGYKTLPYTTHLGRPLVADNMYLSLLVETGWPGLAALIGASAAVLVQSYRQARSAASKTRRFCGAWMFSFWCGLMVQMASGDILTYWRILPAFFAVLAIGARDENPDPGPVL